MRIIGVPVIHRHPLELGAKIALHLAHQVAGVGLQVLEIVGILRRDDESELVPIILATRVEIVRVDPVGMLPVELATFAIGRYAITLDVTQMLLRGARTRASEIHQTRLNHDAA